MLVTVVYAAAFVPLYREAGVGVSALSIFPVVVLGWLFGAWGGLLAGILGVGLNAILLHLVGEPGWQIVVRESGAEGSALVLVVGCVIGLLRDLGLRLDRHLTDWRTAERALRDTEDRYRILFERSRDAIYVSHPDGRITEANEALERLFGYRRIDLLDLDVTSLYEDPADRVRFQEEIQREGYVEDFPVHLRMRDGSIRDCLITATARFDSDRKAVEYQGSIRDVSESRALHQLADRRTRELQEAVRELEAFSYSVSHDLRTHLVTMGGFASILWTDYRESLDEKGQEFLQRIVDAGHRMDRFVQDLLSYSRVTRIQVKRERVSLSDVVEETLAALEAQIAERGANVVVEGALPVVQADRTLLGRSVENLLSNAVKFVPPDRTPEVRIRARVDGRKVRLEVQDNGMGIPEDQVERAFRAFERLDAGNFPGTGVGLTIVQKAVERMGGKVGVESKPGEGSTLWIELAAGE
jgi:PAS domain S-box-containing protein